MVITINDPSTSWPSNYNANVGSLDTAEVEELTDVSLDPAVPYDQDVLQWDDGQSLWVNVDVLQGSLPVTYATWDSTCKDTGINLSRDDRVAYGNTSYHLVTGTLGSDTVSKYYFEMQHVSGIRVNSSYARFGVGYVTNCTTLQGNDYHWYFQGDGYLKDSSDSILYSGMPSIGQGEYVGFAVEVVGTTCNVWVRSPDDGTWLHGDPETSTSPSFTFSTGGYEISPLCCPAWLTYAELKVRDSDMKWGRPDGFYELRTNNFSSTTTTTT